MVDESKDWNAGRKEGLRLMFEFLMDRIPRDRRQQELMERYDPSENDQVIEEEIERNAAR